eukprot:TRINITY_DN10741_c0_g2_i1.p1 TRINITY_DN10741_c0_g2~~TRINITY_DN10741_c0_g2_i1.p1  ORF type:complete len:179 (-),score=25.62 TRINITY_DN10741_c0_g2_i1:46-561(-)
MGGKTSLLFGMLFPEIIDRMLIVDAAPSEYNHGHTTLFDALMDFQAVSKTRKINAMQFLKKKGVDAATIQYVLQNNLHQGRFLAHLPTLATAEKEGEFRLFPLNGDDVKDSEIDINVRFLAGEKSPRLPPPTRQQISRMFKRSTFDLVPGNDHFLHNRKDFAPKLLQFLRE